MENKNEGMKTSTKVMTWVVAVLLTLSVLGGVVMGLGTIGGDEGYQEQESPYSTSNSPF